jgi:triosephosphate isomerase
VAVCCPYPYLDQTQQFLSGSAVLWGAQDVSEYDPGAYTGEVSVEMLSDFNCRYVIVGHSERRALYGETSETVAAKADRAMKGGLVPIVCVGETLSDRDAGRTTQIVAAQLAPVLDRLDSLDATHEIVVAYEPVWAIGTGRTATPQEAQDVHAFLRSEVARIHPGLAAVIPIIYGGSVKAGNAVELFEMPDIDGGLIGGAALVAKDFLSIAAAAGTSA